MGFYSIYKILKDMIRTLFGKNGLKLIILCILLTIVLFVLDKKTVQASSNEFTVGTMDSSIDYELLHFNLEDIRIDTDVNSPSTSMSLNIYINKEIFNDSSYSFKAVYTQGLTKYENGTYRRICLNLINTTTTQPYYTSGNSWNINFAYGERVYSFINIPIFTELTNNVVTIYINDMRYFNASNQSLLGADYIYNSSSDTHLIYSNIDLYRYDSNNQLYRVWIAPYNQDEYYYPFFSVTSNTTFQSLTWDYIFINPNDYGFDEPLYFHCLKSTDIIDNTYYYSDTVFRLAKDSSYYNEGLTDLQYYTIPKYKFNFDTNSTYYLVLNNSSEPINNTNGVITQNYENNIFQVEIIDTTSKITTDDVISDNTKNTSQEIEDIKDILTDDNISEDNQDQFSNILNPNNENNHLSGINNGFFSRLTNMITNAFNYNDNEVEYINLPVMNTQKNITIPSNILSSHIPTALKLLINSFWLYLFGFYSFKYINKLYIAIKSGTILDNYSNSEAITQDML